MAFPFLRLPTELHLMIAEFLDPASAVALKNANKYLRSTITVDIKNFELDEVNLYYMTLELWPE
jgi:hypothetical protein